MKTKVRIIKSGIERNQFSGNSYQHLVIEFLGERYKGTEYLEPYCSISFQAHDSSHWYGQTFKTETYKVEHVELLLKIIREVKAKLYYDFQPQEIIDILNSEIYVYDNGEFIPVKYQGTNKYLAYYTEGGKEQGYKIIYARNLLLAKEEIKKIKEIPYLELRLIEENINISGLINTLTPDL